MVVAHCHDGCVPVMTESVAMVGQGALVLRLEDPDHFLNIPRSLATTESAYIRGAVNHNRRVVCGIGEIQVDPDLFGPRQYTNDVLQIPVIEKFFAFLQSKDIVKRVVSSREELGNLEAAYQEVQATTRPSTRDV